MTKPLLKISIGIGLITAVVILLYEFTNLLLVYHYFKYEYYLAGIAIAALVTGVILTNRYHQQQTADLTNSNPLEILTAKELHILELIASGKSNKEIASANYIEISTVKTHINNLFFKLNVKNRKDAAKIYHQYLENQKSTLSPPARI
ncbi:response regulator transcription factor [Mucilaginibacter lappiensis]|uniref:DNA-binding CsgD family transcriptional regulator n=1 Tax=Mucilaginibacter lappiensis TaxID=354630 RepID=A0A841JEN2_9SPHI|nr:helix-turn-helix transcriptional regulator [Mucilaginibacter lappiensis]MBB6126915.1 DNA-binding CsgD family transcriptional regulator [Mucilaginibacter lappiensis]